MAWPLQIVWLILLASWSRNLFPSALKSSRSLASSPQDWYKQSDPRITTCLLNKHWVFLFSFFLDPKECINEGGVLICWLCGCIWKLNTTLGGVLDYWFGIVWCLFHYVMNSWLRQWSYILKCNAIQLIISSSNIVLGLMCCLVECFIVSHLSIIALRSIVATIVNVSGINQLWFPTFTYKTQSATEKQLVLTKSLFTILKCRTIFVALCPCVC